MNDLSEQKKALRLAMKMRRDEHLVAAPHAARHLRDHVLNNFHFPAGSVIASYHAFGSEMDPLHLVEALRMQGHHIALPVVTGKGQPLLFRRFDAGDPLATSSFGQSEPLATAAVVQPDILLIPMLAFDRQLYRLGYGGGFYDRTLAALRAEKPVIALGLAYAGQEVDAVPRHDHDARLDKIFTEIQAFAD